MNRTIEKNLKITLSRMSKQERKECKRSEEDGQIEMAKEMLKR